MWNQLRQQLFWFDILEKTLFAADTDGKIVGQLPQADGQTGDQFGLVLPKGSPLTKKVSAAVDALRTDGTLDKLAAQWLAADGDAPVLK